MAAKNQTSGNRSRSTGSKTKSAGSTTTKKTGNTSRSKSKTSSKKPNTTKNTVTESIWFRYHDEILLLGTLVLSVLLLLSNFHLCGPVGEFINRTVFGLVGFLAYLFPVLLFFGVALYLLDK